MKNDTAARAAYERANAEQKLRELDGEATAPVVSRESAIREAEELVQREKYEQAITVLRAANAQPELVALGNRLRDTGGRHNVHLALRAYRAAEARDELLSLAEAYGDRNTHVAISAYRAAGAHEQLRSYAERLAARNDRHSMHAAVVAFTALKGPSQRLVALGDRLLALGIEREAWEAYRTAARFETE